VTTTRVCAIAVVVAQPIAINRKKDSKKSLKRFLHIIIGSYHFS
jgi:hypothetical protein